MKILFRAIIVVSILLFLVLIIKRNYFIFNYYMWQLSYSDKAPLLAEEIEPEIQKMAPAIIDLLINTFKDGKTKYVNLLVVARGIIKVDKERAEEIFIQYLSIGNRDQVIVAAIGIEELKSKKGYTEMAKLAEHKDPFIRSIVAKYLKSSL